MAERYTIDEVVRIVQEYGTARYNEGVHDALRRPQAASGAHATAKDRLADVRFMLAYGIKPPGVSGAPAPQRVGTIGHVDPEGKTSLVRAVAPLLADGVSEGRRKTESSNPPIGEATGGEKGCSAGGDVKT